MDLLREKLRARGAHRAQVAAAMIGSAVVGGVMSSSAAKSAANTQADAANRATDSQNAMFDKTVGLEQPFRQAGIGAMSKLNGLLGVSPQDASGSGFDEQAYLAANPDVAQYIAAHPAGTPGATTALQHYQTFGQQEHRSLGTPTAGTAANSPDFGSLLKPFSTADFQEDPGIQFQTQQGNLALTNSNAAQNGSLSGAALKSLIGYNQQMAGLGYQGAFDRYMANKDFTLGSLMDQEKVGQAAASGAASTAPAFSAGISSTIQGAGNAQAAGAVGSANALSGGLTGGSNAYLLRNLLSNGNGNGTPNALNLGIANLSSDPIGSLNSQMNWTGA